MSPADDWTAERAVIASNDRGLICLCTCSDRIGSAITGASYKETSGTIIYQLEAGDKLYAMVEGTGHAMFVPQGEETRNTFNAHLLYKSLV